MDKINLMSISVSTGSYQDMLKKIITTAQAKTSCYTCVANVHMLVEASWDASFAQVVNNAHVITPDGKPLTWALKILYGRQQERVAGMDLLPDLLKLSEEQELPVYFLGGTDEILNKTKQYLSIHYPSLIVKGVYSPPFRDLTSAENQDLASTINASGAHLLFVSLGCPKQEKWMASMKGLIQASMIGIGGALPVMIGLKARAPKWMQNAGLEWVYRLGQEPSRLFKRYAVTNSYFVYSVFKDYIYQKTVSKKVDSLPNNKSLYE